MRKAIVCLLTVVMLSAYVAGCGPKGAGRDPNMYDGQDRLRTGTLEHTVKYPGETLSIIAGWYTGRTDNWRRIVDVNPGLKPEKIRLGQVIMIPMEIVIQEQPLTADAVRKFRPSGARPGKEQKDLSGMGGMDGGNQPPPADLFDSEPGTKADGGTPTEVVPSNDNVRPTEPTPPPTSLTQPGQDLPAQPTNNPSANDTPPAKDAKKSPTKDDAEREKLLDELLSQ